MTQSTGDFVPSNRAVKAILAGAPLAGVRSGDSQPVILGPVGFPSLLRNRVTNCANGMVGGTAILVISVCFFHARNLIPLKHFVPLGPFLQGGAWGGVFVRRDYLAWAGVKWTEVKFSQRLFADVTWAYVTGACSDIIWGCSEHWLTGHGLT